MPIFKILLMSGDAQMSEFTKHHKHITQKIASQICVQKIIKHVDYPFLYGHLPSRPIILRPHPRPLLLLAVVLTP